MKFPQAFAAVLAGSAVFAHAQAPKPGEPAPALTANHLLQAPAGTALDWPSLRGKTVVLEFWATWCGPCVAEIPVLNSLAASADPAKVRFLSVDDEDPALVEAFLKKHPISGWVALDTTGKVFDRYGVLARPATIIVGPDGRVATADAHPETLRTEQLLALADGKPVDFAAHTGTGSASPAALAERRELLDKEFKTPTAHPSGDATPAIAITPGDKGDTRMMLRSASQFDITNASPRDLLQLGAGIRPTRLTVLGELPDKQYNLHVEEPNMTPAELSRALELAIASATGLRIEPKTAMADAYVLEATDGAAQHAPTSPYPGGAGYSKKQGKLQAVNATLDQFAAALEKALGTPVIDETGLTGKLTLVESLPPGDLAATDALLAKDLNLKLVPAKRPVTTYTVSSPVP